MKIESQTNFIATVRSRVFVAENIAVPAVAAVLLPFAVTLAES